MVKIVTVLPAPVQDILAQKQDNRRSQGACPGLRYKAGRQWRVVIDTVVREDNGDLLVAFQVEETGEVKVCDLADWRKVFTEPARPETDHWDDRPKQGSTWQHFKGNTYRIVANGFHVDTGAHLVMYKDAEKNYVWAREIASWLTTLTVKGKSLPRFAEVR